MVDVETTGLFPFRHDRVVEVAAVVMRDDGRVEREFVSLVNPSRDVGPSRIHGLTSADVLQAPRFAEIAALLVDVLEGTVAIAAHNVRFDRQFLESEFSRIDRPLPECFSLCTMQLSGGGKLSDCCGTYGIPTEGEAHHALADARAAARLLAALLELQPRLAQDLGRLTPIQWPAVPHAVKQAVTRNESRRRQDEPPSYLQRLLARMNEQTGSSASDGGVMAYRVLLDRILEDRCVDEAESEALLETGVRWGLTRNQVLLAHHAYVRELVRAAVADGVITEAEKRDLALVARLLGQERTELDEMIAEAVVHLARSPAEAPIAGPADSSLAGMRVCFTGEMNCSRQGRLISREDAEALASRAGLQVVDSVTKKLDLLVVGDPQTMSGKAKKARQYSVRIMHEPVFWRALGVEVD